MKGLELPINMIVVVAIAVLVLVVVAAFFAGRLGSGTSEINLEAAFGQGCNTLRSVHNCNTGADFDVRGYTPPGAPAGQITGFYRDVCRLKGFLINSECARACGCPVI